jgi:hypothetical protein
LTKSSIYFAEIGMFNGLDFSGSNAYNFGELVENNM